jgi:nucleoside-diphosphate-sugar epimerase
VHFAAAVGVGQSMYEIERYTSVNALGAAVVLERALAVRDRLEKVVVASSAPTVAFEDGMRELAEWLVTQSAVDKVDEATAALADRGLTS